MEAGAVFVPKTVLLETEWVLRRAYDLASTDILDAFEALARAAEVEFENPDAVQWALAWYRAGMDFADALHIASKGTANEFLTFDKRLTAAARKANIKGVVKIDK
jgi:predicted nucleic-acid-binding protein